MSSLLQSVAVNVRQQNVVYVSRVLLVAFFTPTGWLPGVQGGRGGMTVQV